MWLWDVSGAETVHLRLLACLARVSPGSSFRSLLLPSPWWGNFAFPLGRFPVAFFFFFFGNVDNKTNEVEINILSFSS